MSRWLKNPLNIRKYQTNGNFTGTNSSSSSNFKPYVVHQSISSLCAVLTWSVGEWEDVREILPVRFPPISSHSSAYYFLDISPSSSFCVLFRFIIFKCSLSDAIHSLIRSLPPHKIFLCFPSIFIVYLFRSLWCCSSSIFLCLYILMRVICVMKNVNIENSKMIHNENNTKIWNEMCMGTSDKLKLKFCREKFVRIGGNYKS